MGADIITSPCTDRACLQAFAAVCVLGVDVNMMQAELQAGKCCCNKCISHDYLLTFKNKWFSHHLFSFSGSWRLKCLVSYRNPTSTGFSSTTECCSLLL